MRSEDELEVKGLGNIAAVEERTARAPPSDDARNLLLLIAIIALVAAAAALLGGDADGTGPSPTPAPSQPAGEDTRTLEARLDRGLHDLDGRMRALEGRLDRLPPKGLPPP